MNEHQLNSMKQIAHNRMERKLAKLEVPVFFELTEKCDLMEILTIQGDEARYEVHLIEKRDK